MVTGALSYFQVNMKILGQSFPGTTHYLDTQRRLERISSKTSWFTEYRPIRFHATEIMVQLLLEVFKRQIYCHLAGSFVCFTAGVFRSYKAVSLYVALTDNPIINLIFQKGPEQIDHFTIGTFHFRLLNVPSLVDQKDIFWCRFCEKPPILYLFLSCS